MFLIDDILMSPVNLTIWLAEKIKEQADAEIHDVGKIKEALAQLQERYDVGQMTEEEFHKEEARWLERLQAAQEYHKAQASGEASASRSQKARESEKASEGA